MLGEQYGDALEGGLLQLRYDAGALSTEYRGLRLPINPRRSPLVFGHDDGALAAEIGEHRAELREFLSILTALRNLPPYTERDPRKISERQGQKEVARQRLHTLATASPGIRAHIEAGVRAFNGTVGEPASFDRLHELLELQAYRLASWKSAADEINYRRFFDVNELAGLRVDPPHVFDAIHRLVFQLIEQGVVTGLCIDHVDGLLDPGAYLQRLQAAAQARRPRVTPRQPFYIVVEKILSAGEALLEAWPVAGTTGYTFLNEVNGLLVDSRGRASLHRMYTQGTGRHDLFPDVAYESKRWTPGHASTVPVMSRRYQRVRHRLPADDGSDFAPNRGYSMRGSTERTSNQPSPSGGISGG